MSAATREMSAATREMSAATRAFWLQHDFCSLGGGLRSPQGGPPPLYMKKHHWLKVIFRPWGAKKIKKIEVENDPR